MVGNGQNGKNGWKWLEMARNGWEWRKMPWKWLDNWKVLKMAGNFKSGLKWLLGRQ